MSYNMDELFDMATQLSPVKYENEAYIITQGETITTENGKFYIVAKGKVVVRVDKRDVRERVEGEYFGEGCFIGSKRGADVVAQGPVTVLEMKVADFEKHHKRLQQHFAKRSASYRDDLKVSM